MFTKKPEPDETVTKLGKRPSSSEKSSPFTERPATFSKGPGPSTPSSAGSSSAGPSKMVPSIIGEDLTVIGNVASKGEIQVDGEIQGDLDCGSLLLGEKSQIHGSVRAEDVVVRGKVIGSIRGLRVTLQSQSHVEGDIYHQSIAIEQGAYFEGKSRRSDDPMADGKSTAPRSESSSKSEENSFSGRAAE
jgi:cytoskeletal protein CcmA (bactofilin family)